MSFFDEDKKELLEIIQRDVDLFRKQELMDYSLILAVTSDSSMNMNFLRLSRKSLINLEYIETLREKYKGNKNVYVSPLGYIYNIGIIDYLQEFDFSKIMENRFKRLRFGSKAMEGISAIDPEPYAKRYMRFIKRKILSIIA